MEHDGGSPTLAASSPAEPGTIFRRHAVGEGPGRGGVGLAGGGPLFRGARLRRRATGGGIAIREWFPAALETTD
jgi:hypothetical protein